MSKMNELFNFPFDLHFPQTLIKQQQQQQCQEVKQPVMWQPFEPNNNIPTDPQTAAAVAAAAFLQ